MDRMLGNLKNTAYTVKHRIEPRRGTINKTLTSGGAIATVAYTADTNRKTETIKRCDQVDK